MATVTASGVITLPVQQWMTVLRKDRTILVTRAPTSKKGNLVERSIAAKHPGSVRGHSKIERRILFPRRTGILPKYCRNALNSTQKLNMTLPAAKVPLHIHIHQVNYNEIGNLSGSMAPTSTSSILLPQHQELVLRVVRQLDQNITNARETSIDTKSECTG